MTRKRACNNPAPANGGAACVGPVSESRACNTHPCGVDGNWGMWSAYSACTAKCGVTGYQRRTRECNNPAAQYGGKACVGPAYQDRVCTAPCAPATGGSSGGSSGGRSGGRSTGGSGGSGGAGGSGVTGISCVDENVLTCGAWAKAGYCSDTTYYLYMTRKCCASCRSILQQAVAPVANVVVPAATTNVVPAATTTNVVPAATNNVVVATNNVVPAATTNVVPAATTTNVVPAATTNVNPAPATTVTCVDDLSVPSHCQLWKNNGLCTDPGFIAYMSRMCCKTCRGSSNIREVQRIQEGNQLRHKPSVYMMRIYSTLRQRRNHEQEEVSGETTARSCE